MDMTEAANGNDRISDREWENRVLCSDESCIGVIGADGRCKECGKPYEGELPDAAPPAEDDSIDGAAGDAEPSRDPAPEAAPATEADDDEADDWEKRTLCSDENCIGVIGPDGHCKECGKPYAG
jgi:hypothetical protein